MKPNMNIIIPKIDSFKLSLEILFLTKLHNDRLKKKIFGSNADNNLSFKILPTSNGAYLNLSYKF